MYKNWISLWLMLFASLNSFSQATLSGKITEKNGLPILGASVLIHGTSIGAVTDEYGNFELTKLPFGNYELEISFIGFKKQRQPMLLQKGKPIFLNVTMVEKSQELNEVVIKGKSKEQHKREEPIKIEVIDIEKIHAQSVSLPQIINQTSGVKIRQNGGVGSSTSININGLQGNAIRFFRDGLPLDYMGSAFNLSLLPIDQISNVEIYKGVLPVDLGADALGGAVNFISKKSYKDNLNVTYGLGSFNTHQFTLNGNLNIPKSKLFASVSSYYVYSDNNYKIDAEIPDDFTGNLKVKEIERFHDATKSIFVETKLGVSNLKIADLFEISISYFDFYKELQNNIRLTKPYGEIINTEESLIFTTRYQKKFNKLNIDVFGAYSNRKILFDDTPQNRYNWQGESTLIKDDGGEVSLNNKFYRNTTFNNFTVRVNADYELLPNHQLNFNHNYINERRIGSDPFAQSENKLDVLTIPAKYIRNITGLGLTSSFLEGKLNNIITLKRYGVKTSSVTSSIDYFGIIPKISSTNFGIGNSIKYNINSNRYLRFSFERATRIPETREYFGDAVFITGNSNLNIEKSNNVNFGYYTNLNKNKTLWLDINSFYRYVEDNIFLRPYFLVYSRYENTDDSQVIGGELTFKGTLKERFKFNLSMTYQDIRRKDVDISSILLKGSRQPNIPYFFGNLNLSYSPKEFLGSGNWQFYSNYGYVEQYLLNAIPKNQEPLLFGKVNLFGANIIPTQNLVDTGVTYTISKIPLTLNIELNNLLNTKAYDGFRVQKPGTNYRLKIKYSIN
ncbi:TonB-dependent receptor [Tenacibaculum finnmarkense]|uniref:TonB-dependent receptor n=1 Tax=Tenacibaculum finnmarkense TaxID=2781243 RepID=UPI001E3D06B5|nr:TonB-dependent receptor [Tenacibaculum finnmarkense]MCD8422292.1 carboxypeptidase-like regulatory domain-containing protein [Tenacibaculum finnmarkense genomovar ulcerans]MCD8432332.1 carboxypeptidase-like regulatory domain-containing protein [Tenacibaculum finnmarkense genomovar ulcerans]MCG8235857.1 TonB-dependent receptor [Tenacibaculum finnmarkense genomovar ulcerans]MCG8238297.1 TonB-dependent receptor [Tenacibaculum finnmarkense genomovar ulcerans]MCG8785178.1 TonB-dependent receptor 